MKFWETTWGQLAPGDEIQAPDGTIWTVGAAIICDGRGEWEISNPQLKVHLWTEQPENGKVSARRPFTSPVPLAHVKHAEALLADLLGAERVEAQ